jgi:hypothetical protein
MLVTASAEREAGCWISVTASAEREAGMLDAGHCECGARSGYWILDKDDNKCSFYRVFPHFTDI